MVELARGPLVWVALLGFSAGIIYQMIVLLSRARRERTVLPTWSWRYGARSLLHWVVPFASRSMRLHPMLTTLSFAFHLALLGTPLLVMGHAVLWEQAWGVSWYSLPQPVADALTALVVAAGLLLLLRRLVLPEVRQVSSLADYALLLLAIAPFATGFVAYHQWLPYRVTMIAHIVCGALWLLAIPFTRLSHMLWFAFTRAYMGSECGAVRHAKDW